MVTTTKKLDVIVNHFLRLYNEELKQVTPDTIFEWWSMTRDQYPDVPYKEVEEAILKAL